MTFTEESGPTIFKEEMIKTIKGIKERRVAWSDEIPREILKWIIEHVDISEQLFNVCGTGDNEWPISTFIPVPKNANPCWQSVFQTGSNLKGA